VRLEKLIARARGIQATGDMALGLVGSVVRDFALDVMDLLSEADPCGWERPDADLLNMGPVVRIPQSWASESVDPADARHLARMLLRAADEAEDLAP
jgi:hypothetical protein